ncbi:MAG: methyltransferase domain-containing protein [Nitrospirae bacterium]|nr:methyltransferase domain-containing protein [Nitrospirota bacterium]
MLRATFRSILQPLVSSRTARLARLLAAELSPGDHVLDVGCGDLLVGQQITHLLKVQWTGVDILEYHRTGLPFHRYDGRTLPFPPNHFSTVLLSFVLHHCEDPDAILRECVRVSSSRLLMVEDIPEGRMEIALAKVHDYLANNLTQEGIPRPYRFKSLAGWQSSLASLDLDVVRIRPLHTHPLAFVKQSLLVAAKKASPNPPASTVLP